MSTTVSQFNALDSTDGDEDDDLLESLDRMFWIRVRNAMRRNVIRLQKQIDRTRSRINQYFTKNGHSSPESEVFDSLMREITRRVDEWRTQLDQMPSQIVSVVSSSYLFDGNDKSSSSSSPAESEDFSYPTWSRGFTRAQ